MTKLVRCKFKILFSREIKSLFYSILSFKSTYLYSRLDKYFLYFISKRSNLKPNYFKKQNSLSSITYPRLIIQVQNWPGELVRLDPCISDMGLACWLLHCHLNLYYYVMLNFFVRFLEELKTPNNFRKIQSLGQCRIF